MRYTLVLLLVLFVMGCDINPSEFGKEEASKFGNTITYVKDKRTGLCFGIVASRKTGEWDQSGMGLTQVPCEAVKEWL